ncbi:uncharacterized mitochondrial protein AtMg00810-like [Solanum tuberosum]|uniref:uncharacterized mitochondrial protein AtMg00810-like n=1 Tax=Solanum tuberosum TaxID=4113 RepID=UPI00073A1D24|nr:PREDICTED: uncharacterized mitochondrial protein AtMg00810-like [Solanum tuberosum]
MAFLRRTFILRNLKDFQSKGMYQLKKALYGLKQAPKAWYNTIDEHLAQLDDILVTGRNDELVKRFKEDMRQTFEMTNLGEMVYFLGMEIKQGQIQVLICQINYAKDILKIFRMENCKETTTPMCQKEKLSKNDDAGKMDETLYQCLAGCCNWLSFLSN